MKLEVIEQCRCPRCRAGLSLERQLVTPSLSDGDGELHEGLLTCPGCDALYPVICGVAIIMPKVKSWLRDNYYYVAEGALNAGGIGPGMANYLDQQGWRMSAAPKANYYELPRWVDMFLSTHYDPVPAGSNDDSKLGRVIAGQPSVFDFVTHNLSAGHGEPVNRALDVGSNVGGMAARLTPLAKHVIAIDTAFNPLLAARKLQLAYPQRQSSIRRYTDGLRYEDIAVGPFKRNVEFLLGSIFDLPVTGEFDIISVLNVIDVVPDPQDLIDVLIERLAPSGRIVFTSPYSWGSDDVPIDNWLGDERTDSSQHLIQLLTERQLEIVAEADCVPWVLREHKRWYRVFHNHCVIAQMNGA